MVWVCFHYIGNLYSLFDTNLYVHHHQRSQTKVDTCFYITLLLNYLILSQLSSSRCVWVCMCIKSLAIPSISGRTECKWNLHEQEPPYSFIINIFCVTLYFCRIAQKDPTSLKFKILCIHKTLESIKVLEKRDLIDFTEL